MGYILTTTLEMNADDFEVLCDIGDHLYDMRRAEGYSSWVPFFSRAYDDKTVKRKGDKVHAEYSHKFNVDNKSEYDIFKHCVSTVPHEIHTEGEDGEVFDELS